MYSTYMCIHTRLYIYIYIHTSVCVCVCTGVFIYIYIYIYTHAPVCTGVFIVLMQKEYEYLLYILVSCNIFTILTCTYLLAVLYVLQFIILNQYMHHFSAHI